MSFWDILNKSDDDEDEINQKADLAAMAAGLDTGVQLDPNASLSTNSSIAEADAKVKKEKFRSEYRKYLENDDGSTTSSLMASALIAVLPAVAGYAIDKTRGAGNALSAAGQAIPNIYAAEKKASDEKKAKKMAILKLDQEDLKDSSKLAQALTMKSIEAKQRGDDRAASLQNSKTLAVFKQGLKDKPNDPNDPEVAAWRDYQVRKANGENVQLTQEALRGSEKTKGGLFALNPIGANTRLPDDKVIKTAKDSFRAVYTIKKLNDIMDEEGDSTAGALAAGKALIPGTKAYRFHGELKPLQQDIASAVQSGVLTDQDRDIYDPIVSGSILLDTEDAQRKRLAALNQRLKIGVQREMRARSQFTNLSSVYAAYPELFSEEAPDQPSSSSFSDFLKKKK